MNPSLAGMAFFMGEVNRASTVCDGTAFWHRFQGNDGRLTDYGPPTLAEAEAELSKFPRHPVGAGPPGGPRFCDRTVVAGEQQLRAAMKPLKLGSRRLKRERVGRLCHCRSVEAIRDHNGRLAPLFSHIT